jgi:hypothetical protein
VLCFLASAAVRIRLRPPGPRGARQGRARQVRQERPTRESQGWAILRFARVHGWPMKGALHSPIRFSWATADRNAKRAIASLISSQRASRMAEGNPPLRDRACARDRDLNLTHMPSCHARQVRQERPTRESQGWARARFRYAPSGSRPVNRRWNQLLAFTEEILHA